MFLVCFYIFESARFNAKILPELRSRATKPAWAQGCSRARKTQDGYDSPCSISAPSKTAIAALLGRLAIHESIGPSHEDGTSDGVANGHGEQVVHEDHFPGDLGALEEAHREEEHVGDRVLEAHRDKGRDREPDAKHLADYVLCRGRLPDAHDDEIGSQMPNTLPTMSFAAVACQMPMTTSQLQRMPRITAWPNGRLAFMVVIALTVAAEGAAKAPDANTK